MRIHSALDGSLHNPVLQTQRYTTTARTLALGSPCFAHGTVLQPFLNCVHYGLFASVLIGVAEPSSL